MAEMGSLARDVMTTAPSCCTATATLDQVAKLMVQNDCGEIPVVDRGERLVGVITDRDIVCRVVADGKNPMAHTAEQYMSQPVLSVTADTPIPDIMQMMEKHQIRRVPVVDKQGCCVGIIAQADLAWTGRERDVAELVREVSRESGRSSR
jgi:CBS domain-containing protein